MQRASPVKRRRVRVRSRSPIPVHYIDLTADSPVTTTTTTTTAHGRRRLNDNGNVKAPSTNETNHGASSQRMEMIEILDTPESVRPRTPRKQNNKEKSPNKSASVSPANNLKIHDAKEESADRIPAVNDSFDGLTPTVLLCPICYEDLRSSRKPMATKCGHLFCELCIQATLSSRKKCPVCMASITIKSCIRLHF